MSNIIEPNTRKSVYIDLDGTVFEHHHCEEDIPNDMGILLDKVKERFDEWRRKKYTVIITTGRNKGLKKHTIAQLKHHGLKYKHLLMDIGAGERVIVNDEKPSGFPSARAIVVKRDGGLGDVEI